MVAIPNTRFGETLAKLREEKLGVTQEALSRSLGVDYTTISRWEAGNRVPSRERLERFYGLPQLSVKDVDSLFRAAGLIPSGELFAAERE